MNDTINKGVIGVSGAMFGIAISKATLIVWLQMASLIGGLIVTGLTIFSIWLSIKRKLRNWKLEQKINPKDASLYEEESTTI